MSKPYFSPANKNLLVLAILMLLVTNIMFYIKKTRIQKNQTEPITKHNFPFVPNNPPSIENNPPEPPKKIEPKWENYPPIREVSNLGKVLSDIESHMPTGHIYRDNDKITWAHETTHGINSNLRQKFNHGGEPMKVAYLENGKPVFAGGRINGFYCLENKAAIIEEPKTTIQKAAALVPQSLRGPVYNLYMVQQAKSWGDTPLYIFDEWVAYTNGSACRLDLNIQERSETVSQMFEFNVYSIALAMAIKKETPSYDDTQFKAFLTWNIERSYEIYKGEERAKTYLETLKNSADAASLRQFSKEYFGEEWTKNILKF